MNIAGRSVARALVTGPKTTVYGPTRHGPSLPHKTADRNPCRNQPVPSDVFGTVTGMGHLLGYARVSTTGQDPALQSDALSAAGSSRVYVDVASGSRDDRPQLAALLERVDAGDTVVVWRLDRLGRSLRHLVDTVTTLGERGVGFRSLQESIDTTTAGGRLVFHVFAALAEFERDLIRDRTVAGLDAALARGRRGGRPTTMTPAKLVLA